MASTSTSISTSTSTSALAWIGLALALAWLSRRAFGSDNSDDKATTSQIVPSEWLVVVVVVVTSLARLVSLSLVQFGLLRVEASFFRAVYFFDELVEINVSHIGK